ncbi:MAG: hypothetical protein OER56_08935, partial [Hyphomicrobiales bacterium]|nr:hypothetical protein [Hyphomicrobiales bacterium]
MGLGLTVGLLADLKQEDPEFCDELIEEFAVINKLLEANGLSTHSEPDNIEVWDADMPGYSGIHYLRRLAAHVDSGQGMPEPGDDDSSDDEILQAYYEDNGKFSFQRRFDHLILHSDADGSYVPIDFPKVLASTKQIEINGHYLGSSQQLLRECDKLAKPLEIPEEFTSESSELFEAAAYQGQGECLWQRYGTESFC